MNRSRIILRLGFAVFGLLLAGIGPASATQVIHFKNGFELAAIKVRFEGQMIILTLEGGSELGFPQWAVEDMHQNDEVGGVSNNPDGWDQRKMSQRAAKGRIRRPPGAVGPNALNVGTEGDGIGPEGLSIGFSTNGSQVHFGGAEGPVASNGRVGRSLTDLQAARKDGSFRKPKLVLGNVQKGSQQ